MSGAFLTAFLGGEVIHSTECGYFYFEFKEKSIMSLFYTMMYNIII